MTAPWYTDPANLARLVAYLASDDPSLTAADVARDVLPVIRRWVPEYAVASVACPECKSEKGDSCRDLDTGCRLRGAHATRIEDAHAAE